MPEYYYTARTPDGKLKKDSFRAKDEKALGEYLKSQGFILTTSKLAKKSGKFALKGLLDRFQRVPMVQKVFFTQNLSVMIRTGFSLALALNTLAQQSSNKKLQSVVLELKADVENGTSFSSALTKHPTVFSELFVNMVAAGEASGKLDEVLVYLTNQMRKEHGLIAKVRSAMMYPIVITVAMVAIGIIMMITVVPQITSIYSESKLDLPLPTKLLIFISNLMTHQGIYLLIGVIVLSYVFVRFKKTKRGKHLWDTLLLKIPAIGGIIKKINLARFTRTLCSLVKTDIPIVQTFQIISKTLGNTLYGQSMLEASESVKKGVSIVKILEKKPKLFPTVVTQMIAVGEESGTLDTISEEIAKFYEEDVDTTMGGLSAIIEPILMLVIGAVVGVVALAVLMPMYGLVEAI